MRCSRRFVAFPDSADPGYDATVADRASIGYTVAMNPLSEAQAVALLLENRFGFVHIYADGSANWSPDAPVPANWPFAEDCPEGVPVTRRNYTQARTVFRHAVQKLRRRGVIEREPTR
jgi:hypothetical protein